MGKFDSILNVFKPGNDDDEDEYDGYEGYDDDEYDEPAPKASKSSRKVADADSNDDYEERKPARSVVAPKTSNKYSFAKKGSKDMANNYEVNIFKPTALSEATLIVDALLSGKSVVMNLEGIEMSVAMRIFDFITGACYALNGHFEAISKFSYMITPENISISGDISSDYDPNSLIGKDFH